MPKLTDAAAEVQALLQNELAYIRAGNPPRVFFHPGRTANGALDRNRKFIPDQTPEGYELDLAAWDAAGRTGPAPLKQRETVQEEKPPKKEKPERKPAKP